MSSQKVHVSFGPGVGLASLVFLLFLGLKLGGVMPVAAWSWVWIFAPIWIGFALAGTIMAVVLVIAVAFGFFRN